MKMLFRVKPVLRGGVLEFLEVSPETYTVEVKAYKNNVLSGLGDSEVTVVAGETSPCTVMLHDKFTVTFDSNGGTGTMSSQIFTYGTSQSLSENLFTKDGSTFQGWATSIDSDPVYNNASINVFEKNDVTLYAKWSTDGFVFVEGATITEAAPNSEVFIDGRAVTISNFYICDHEVTRGEYETVIGSLPSSLATAIGTSDNNPIGRIIWYNAIVYCNKRSIEEGLTPCYSINGSTNSDEWGNVPSSSSGNNVTWDAATCNFGANGYRLPTEVEWEYAARGGNGLTGTQYMYSGSDTIDDVAWYTDNSAEAGTKGTHEVKTKQANELGLYDMSGNVYEWCWDWNSSISGSTSSTGALSGSNRVSRSGCYVIGADSCSVYKRNSLRPDLGYDNYGFRVVRTAKN